MGIELTNYISFFTLGTLGPFLFSAAGYSFLLGLTERELESCYGLFFPMANSFLDGGTEGQYRGFLVLRILHLMLLYDTIWLVFFVIHMY